MILILRNGNITVYFWIDLVPFHTYLATRPNGAVPDTQMKQLDGPC